jgi:hypothetical protein
VALLDRKKPPATILKVGDWAGQIDAAPQLVSYRHVTGYVHVIAEAIEDCTDRGSVGLVGHPAGFGQHCQAATGGRIGPLPAADGVLGVSGTVNSVAGRLKPGDVSGLVETGTDVYLLKCDRVLPPDPTKTFALEKGALLAEVLREKIDREIPRLFDELKREASPRYHVSFPDPVARPNPVPATTPK